MVPLSFASAKGKRSLPRTPDTRRLDNGRGIPSLPTQSSERPQEPIHFPPTRRRPTLGGSLCRGIGSYSSPSSVYGCIIQAGGSIVKSEIVFKVFFHCRWSGGFFLAKSFTYTRLLPLASFCLRLNDPVLKLERQFRTANEQCHLDLSGMERKQLYHLAPRRARVL